MTCDWNDVNADGQNDGERCGKEDVIQFTLYNPECEIHGDDYTGTEPESLDVQLCKEHAKQKSAVTWQMAIASHLTLIDMERRQIR